MHLCFSNIEKTMSSFSSSGTKYLGIVPTFAELDTKLPTIIRVLEVVSVSKFYPSSMRR